MFDTSTTKKSSTNKLTALLRSRRGRVVLGILLLLLASLLGAGYVYTHKKNTSKTPSATDTSQIHAGSTDTAAPKSSTSSKTATSSKKKTTSTSTSGSSGTSSTSTSSTSGGSTTSGGTSSGGGSSGGGSSTPSVTTLHYAVNIGTQTALASSLGFNLFDVNGSTSNPSNVNTTVNNLPSGVSGLVWVGNLDNTSCTPGFTYSQFTAQVDALKNNSRVFGYYLSDEPHPSVCPAAASDIQARADYIKANAPSQKSFIVVLDGSNMCGTSLGCEYAALKPSITHVDYIGIDPYPCHYAADQVTAVPCDNTAITDRVNSAVSSGIPTSAIVPTFQTFGQSGRTDGKTVYYRMPTTTELTSMLSTWDSLVPNPAFDYSYSFGVQCSTSCPAPQAIANHSEIQTIIKNHNN